MDFTDLPRGLPNTDADSGNAARAVWMSPEAIENAEELQWSPSCVYLGKNILGRTVGKLDDRHLLTVAGSRSGKGQSAILPNLAHYHGSVMVIDPKGENASLTAERRGKGRGVPSGGLGQEIYVIDPFGKADVPEEYLAGYNPIAFLDVNSPNFVDDCDSIADALVVAEAGKADDHWNSSARLVLRGLIAWVAAAPNIKARDLTEVRRILHLPPNVPDGVGFDKTIATMLKNENVAEGVPAEMAGALLGMGDDERGSVLSTARQNVLFISSPPMAAMLSSTKRMPDLAKWKFGNMSVYLCLPATRMHRHSRFFRLFINQLLGAVESTPEVPSIRALMILDEMHVLGHMQSLETAAGLIAGYGVRIWSFWQDFAQLKALYRERWETFLGNASIFQSFGLNDLTTLKYVSERLGTSSTLQISQGEQSMDQAASGYSGQSRSISASPLLTPDEVARYFSRQSGNQLILYTGTSPIFLKREHFYSSAFDNVRGARD